MRWGQIIGNFTLESDMARADYENRVIEKAKAARMVLSQLPSWMWKCDMPQSDQFENESYIQFTELLQVRNFSVSYVLTWPLL